MTDIKAHSNDFRTLAQRLDTLIRVLSDSDTPSDTIEQATRILTATADQLDQLILEVQLVVCPAPTTEEPDWETLQEWLWCEAGCEATDGCWVALDGRCQHDHVSWFLALGLV